MSEQASNSADTDATVYLDNAATSFPKPESVYDAVSTYMRYNGAAVGRSTHAAAEAATRVVEQCRQRLSVILDAESSDRIAFTFNCTDSLNLLLRGCLEDGDRVVASELDHNSVLRPLKQLQKEMNLDVAFAEFDPNSGLIDVNQTETLLKAAPTKLVVLNHASNVTGVVQPLEDIAAVAERYGAMLLLDAAQTAGHIPFSVQQPQIDLLAAAGHKGLLGPLGTGIAYIRRDMDNRIRPVRCGGTGTKSESAEQPETMPSKLESGNMNAPGLAGLNAAAEWLLNSNIEQLHKQAADQTVRLAESLQELPGIRVCCAEAVIERRVQNTGIVSFTIENLDSREAATILEQSFGIGCRAGLHCAPQAHKRLGTLESGGTIRLSVGPFTTDDHIAAAVDAVKQICQHFRQA